MVAKCAPEADSLMVNFLRLGTFSLQIKEECCPGALGFSANCPSLLLKFLVRVTLSRNILNLESPLIFLRKVYTSNLGFYNYILNY